VEIKNIGIDRVEEISHQFNCTFFTNPIVLKRVFKSIDWWAAVKGQEVICIWPVPLDTMGIPDQSLPFTYYVGPIWKTPLPDDPPHRATKLTNEVYSNFLEIFSRVYPGIRASLSPTLVDIRPFTWWRKPGFKLTTNIKYTAQLRVEPLEAMSRKFRQVKRWELKHVPTSKFTISYNLNNEREVVDFYKTLPFHSEAVQEDPNLIPILQCYLRLSPREGCHSISIHESATGKLAAFALLGEHANTFNVLVSCSNNQDYPNCYLSTYLNVLIFSLSIERGAHLIDFNGANGVRLADSKHSFGALPKIYFEIEIAREK